MEEYAVIELSQDDNEELQQLISVTCPNDDEMQKMWEESVTARLGFNYTAYSNIVNAKKVTHDNEKVAAMMRKLRDTVCVAVCGERKFTDHEWIQEDYFSQKLLDDAKIISNFELPVRFMTKQQIMQSVPGVKEISAYFTEQLVECNEKYSVSTRTFSDEEENSFVSVKVIFYK